MLTAVLAAVWILVSVCRLPGCMLTLLHPGSQKRATLQVFSAVLCLPAGQMLRLRLMPCSGRLHRAARSPTGTCAPRGECQITRPALQMWSRSAVTGVSVVAKAAGVMLASMMCIAVLSLLLLASPCIPCNPMHLIHVAFGAVVQYPSLLGTLVVKDLFRPRGSSGAEPRDLFSEFKILQIAWAGVVDEAE